MQRMPVEQKAVFSSAITLVVNFNQHVIAKVEVVHVLHTLYDAVFHQVVFTGQQRPEGLDPHVRWTNCEEPWTFFHLCLVYAMVEFPEPSSSGYLFVGDDTMVRVMSSGISLKQIRSWTMGVGLIICLPVPQCGCLVPCVVAGWCCSPWKAQVLHHR